jgi:hypothetical protein
MQFDKGVLISCCSSQDLNENILYKAMLMLYLTPILPSVVKLPTLYVSRALGVQCVELSRSRFSLFPGMFQQSERTKVKGQAW